jgi:hypothetical protein
MAAISTEWPRLIEMTKNIVSGSIGVVDANALLDGMEKARHGKDTPTISLLRTLAIESWFQNQKNWKLLTLGTSTADDHKLRKELGVTLPNSESAS